MLPIVLNPHASRIGIAGEGDGLSRRLGVLEAAGVAPIQVVSDGDLDGLSVLFVAGLDRDASAALAGRARASGILVNVEDMPDLCDFTMPAIVRRGDLLLTASTNGRAPALARRLREWLEERFPRQWEARLVELGRERDQLRAAGTDAGTIADRTRKIIDEKGWLS